MTDRTATTAPRSDRRPRREWETFVRATPDSPLRHAGSVRAVDEASARETAAAHHPDAYAVWLCPADEVARFDAHDP